MNDIERLMMRRDFGPAVYPELFRLLRETELIFLVPGHPEMEGEIGLENGDPLPPFVVWGSPDRGRRIPVFTSLERADEACRRTGAREGQYALCEMLGAELFHLLSCQTEAIVVNPGCGTPQVFLDLQAAKKLADGSILEVESSESRHGTVRLVDPADYPTDFVQTIFQFLRGRSDVQAAWLFRAEVPPGAPVNYVFVFEAGGAAEDLEREFKIVALNSCPKGAEFGVTRRSEQNAALMQATARTTPFFAAPGYQGPGPLGE